MSTRASTTSTVTVTSGNQRRRVTIRGDTQVQVDGEELTVSGPSIEDVGQTAASIEQMTRVKDKDTRVFQDGVYITEKPQRGEA